MYYIRDRWIYRYGHGLAAQLWGSSAWVWDHAISLQNKCSPREEQHYYFLHGENLSCGSCTTSFAHFQVENPYQIDGKKKPPERQLAILLNKAHNHVNLKNKLPPVSYEQMVAQFTDLDPTIWILALIDYLLSCGVYQIHRETKVHFVKTRIQKNDFHDFTYKNLLPVHRLILFLVSSQFLKSLAHESKVVDRFLKAAVAPETSLVDPELYNLFALKKQRLAYYAAPFVHRLEQVRNACIPGSKKFKLEPRAQLFLAAMTSSS